MDESRTESCTAKQAMAAILELCWTCSILGLGLPIALVSPARGHRVLRYWARGVARLHRIDLRIVDENGGEYSPNGVLFVTLNQTSLAEGFLGPLAIPTPVRPILNLLTGLLPVIGWFLVAMRGVVLIKPWKSQAKRALDRAVETLRTRANFWISIEGQRSPDGELGSYKKGAVVMAIRAQATIVPVHFRGARSIRPFGEWRTRSGTVEVTLCRALSTRGMTLADRDVLVQTLRSLAETKRQSD